MNRTINANIGGMVFHVDEDAYQRLSSYLESIKCHFSTMEGSSEIVEDIEARIAEMLQEKLGGRQIVNIKDVNEVITQMGMPEDFDEPGREKASSATDFGPVYNEKRFFRNPDDKVLGGVCSGISAYFNIDPLWLRLLFVVGVIFFGTGIFIYIILWIIIPEAVTPAEKLQMRGERVNLSNIERTVKEEAANFKKRFDAFADDAKNFQHSDSYRRASSSLGNFLEELGGVIKKVIVVLAKIFAIFIVTIAVVILISFFFALIGVSTAYSVSYPMLVDYIFETSGQSTLATIALILIVVLPVLWILTIGLLYVLKVQYRKRYINLGFIGGWMLGFVLLAVVATQVATDFKILGVERQRQNLPVQSDTFYVNVNEISRYEYDNDMMATIDSDGILFYNDTIVLTDVDLIIENSDNDEIELLSIYSARGGSRAEARKRAAEINFDYNISGNSLTMDQSYSIGNNVWRNQRVRILVKVPKHVYVKMNDEASYIAEDYYYEYESKNEPIRDSIPATPSDTISAIY